MSLKEYNNKRDFKQTAEPKGSKAVSKGSLKFVVQRHAASRLHYDFRLEIDGVLKSWAVPKGPSLNPQDKRLAMKVEDHPFSYRTFEGTIPEGNYGAGEVEIWDEGTYEPIEKIKGKSDDKIMQEELFKESLKFILYGKKLKGEFALVKIKNTDDNSWLLIKHKDAYATDYYNAEEQIAPDSKVNAYLKEKNKIKSESSGIKGYKNYAPGLAGIKKLKTFITPMLCRTTSSAFNDKEWAFEIKWDGYRAIADLRKQPKLYSRNGLDFTERFKKITNHLNLQDHEMILDGEIVAYDDTGKPNFQWLQNIEKYPDADLIYQVFDLLWLNGHSTEELSYLQRKELLKNALHEYDTIKYHDHIIEKGEDFFKAAENMGLEGIIAKRTDSTYNKGVRSSEWLKIKILQTDEVVICGYTAPKGSRQKFGSLLLGKYQNNEIVFCGHTGTGFSDKSLKEIYAKLQPLIIEKSPFKKVPKTNAKATWVKPELVAEVKFTELTKDDILRHPVFMRLREDLDAEDLNFDDKEEFHKPEEKPAAPVKKVIIERENETLITLNRQKVKLTNQNKIYFPKDNISKGDVVAYYQSIAEFILPHLKNRPQSLNRFPNGIDGLSFYQKDAAESTPEWIETQKVFSESNEKYIDYILCNNKAALAYLNNLGCIEMNVWTSSTKNLDMPDYFVLDIDPSENNSFDEVIEVALTVKKILDMAKSDGYCKTSGSSGMHIYIPANAKYSFDQAKDFCHVLMQLVHKEMPDNTTLERSLQKRNKNKIYLDYLQNRRGQTLASVYSLRPKNGATVSMPLEWNELKAGLKPSDFNIENALERIKAKGDIFKAVLGKGLDMLKAIEKLTVN